MNEYQKLLINQYNSHPHMQIQDMVKLIYQSEFAGGHLISNKNDSLTMLQDELNSIYKPKKQDDLQSTNELQLQDTSQSSQEPQSAYESQSIFEYIGNAIYRLNIVPAVKSGLSFTTINNFFVFTANNKKGTMESFENKLNILLESCNENLLPYDKNEVNSYLLNYKSKGYKAVSHTDTYRSIYYPAYRIVSKDFVTYYEVFSNIDILMNNLSKENDYLTVAIDGMSSSGKTTLANLLQDIYDCNVFHMDDYFLPPDLKTEERLKEIGGNVDYARFKAEVISGLKSGNSFTYNIYNCQVQKLVDEITVTPKKLNIIEGSYSMHPTLIHNYDLKVFLKLDPERQSQRILERNGKFMHGKFTQLWIPFENKYFEGFKIQEKSDIVIDEDSHSHSLVIDEESLAHL